MIEGTPEGSFALAQHLARVESHDEHAMSDLRPGPGHGTGIGSTLPALRPADVF
jgi:hypothetical protein